MLSKRTYLVALATLVVCGGFALPCQAQNTLKRHRPLRWLGQGYSDGYHRHNPGYDTSYYNPYSAHNSTLISQSPEYLAARSQHANQQTNRRFFNGVPFSVYAAPPELTPALQAMPSQHFQGTFSPSVGSVLEDEEDKAEVDRFGRYIDDEDEDEAEDNDFREDDNDFRDEQDDADPVDMEDDEDLDSEGLDDREENMDVDTSDLGGLSGLNDSLSFDFD